MGAKVHKYGFIGVYPQGEVNPLSKKPGWNVGWGEEPNDPLFIADLIATLREVGANGRVYMWGGSNGGGLVAKLASNAGVALPISAVGLGWTAMPESPDISGPEPFIYNNLNPPSRPGVPIGLLSVHCTKDTRIPYTPFTPDSGKGSGKGSGKESGKLYGQKQVVDLFAKNNKCMGPSSSSSVSAKYSETGKMVTTSAVHSIWHGCPAKAPVESYLISGCGHGYKAFELQCTDVHPHF